MARPRDGAWGQNAVPTKICRTCGDAFFTQIGLDAHIAEGKHDRYTRRWVTGVFSPAVLPLMQENARALAAVTNARRRRCSDCGHESTPAGVGSHQTHTGHVGWTELEPVGV
jgi:hypothetical protein